MQDTLTLWSEAQSAGQDRPDLEPDPATLAPFPWRHQRQENESVTQKIATKTNKHRVNVKIIPELLTTIPNWFSRLRSSVAIPIPNLTSISVSGFRQCSCAHSIHLRLITGAAFSSATTILPQPNQNGCTCAPIIIISATYCPFCGPAGHKVLQLTAYWSCGGRRMKVFAVGYG